MTLDGPGIAAVIVGIGTAVSIVIGSIRVQSGAAKKQREASKPVPDEEHELPPVPERFDAGEVLEFLKQVRADNVDLRRRDAEKDTKITRLEGQLVEMGEELKLRNRVQEAFSRWLLVIYQSWGKTERPPLPVGDDLMLLRDFIPRE